MKQEKERLIQEKLEKDKLEREKKEEEKREKEKEISKEDALKEFANDEYKIDLINNLPDGSIISTYTQGDFTDLCRGPHVETVKELKIFKLLKYSGAYWKNNADNKMLQRIYGVCFETQEDLDAYMKELEEAKERDHRKIGKEQEIFMTSSLVGAGMPLWLPNGAFIRKQLENYIYDKERSI